MKKNGILNKEICNAIGSIGHTDLLVISDSGLPIASDRYRIDVSIVGGKPGIFDVLEPVLEELEIEKVILAQEIKTISPEALEQTLKRLPEGIEVEYVPHVRFKELTNDHSKAVIRTGEQIPYSSVILVAGVTY
jgi:D-ribose pyranase